MAGAATVPGGHRGFLYCRCDDGAGAGLGADYQRRGDCWPAGGIVCEVAWTVHSFEAGVVLSFTAPFPHGFERGYVQPGGLRDDSYGCDYECHAEYLYQYRYADGRVRYPGGSLFQAAAGYTFGFVTAWDQPPCFLLDRGSDFDGGRGDSVEQRDAFMETLPGTGCQWSISEWPWAAPVGARAGV